MPSAVGLLLVALLASGGEARQIGTKRQTSFLFDGRNPVCPLEHRVLVQGTDSAFVDGEPLGPEDYVVDYEQGVFVLLRRLPAWTPVLVTYRCVEFEGARQVLHRVVVVSDTTAETGADTVAVRATEEFAGDLDVSGSKSLGFTVGGAAGTGVNQATRISVSGAVEGVAIKAELSDQSSPIPPEGTTRELEELDRIVISLKGKGWTGDFGDVDLALPARGFGKVERRAVGGLAAAEAGPAGFGLGYAKPKGRYGRVALSGQDGVQGPYVLAAEGAAAQIVPGSDEIYVDGIRMTRGWDADYTIDYSTGEVVFTNRRIIDRLTRIEARFQYMTEAYDRSDLVGVAELATGPLGCGVGFFREADDPERSYLELSESERRLLGSLGEDSSQAWLDGGRFVGDSTGSYVAEAGVYRYVGPGNGDYDVSFSLVGDSLGDYAYDDSLLAYRHVGPGAGDYVARIRVALPSSDEFVHCRCGLESGGLGASVSGVFQRQSHNLFAEQGGPNQDGALNVDLGWSADRFELGYRGRTQSPGFRFPGADTILDFEYRWDQATPDEFARSNELALNAEPLDFVEVSAEAGVLERRGKEPVQRYEGRAKAGWLVLEAGRSGQEERLGLSAAPTIGRVLPSVGYTRRGRTEEQNETWSAGFTGRPWDQVNAELGYRVQRVFRPDSLGKRLEQERGGLAQADVGWELGDAGSVEATVARQDRRFLAGQADDWEQWLASMAGVLIPRPGYRLQADLGQSYRLARLRDEVFRFVGPGEGDYSRDSVTGRYYYDPDGEYERTVVVKAGFTRAVDRSVVAAGEVSALRPVVLTGSFSSTSLSTDTALLQRTQNHNLRFELRALQPVLTGYVGTNGALSLDRSLAVTGKASARYQHHVEVATSRIPETDLRVRLKRILEERRYDEQSLDYSEQGWRFEAEPVVGTRLRLELALAAEHSVIEEPVAYPELGRFVLLTEEAALARSLEIGKQTRVRGSAGLIHRSSTAAELPFDVALTRPLGWLPTCSFEVNHLLADFVTASARYQFSDRPDRTSQHQLSAELRAYF